MSSQGWYDEVPQEPEPSVPNSGADRDQITLRLIEVALKRGITWAAIARTLRVNDGKTAKKRYHQLQRKVRAREVTR